MQTGRVLFDSKYITAVISDESDRSFFVPIKSVVGNHFLVEIERQIYVFTLKGARILTKRQSATRSFRYINYETSHFRPVSLSDNKEIELVLEQNKLPKINLMLFSVLKELGRREKGTSAKKGKESQLDPPHRLKDLVAEVGKDETRYTEQVRNIKEYLEHLKVEQIVTPVQRMANFLDEDLIQTDPGFYGEIISRFKRTDLEHKIIMNKPVKASKHWVKWIAIMMFVGLIVGAAFLLFGGSNMQLPDFGSMITGLQSPGASSMADFQKLYPTPEAAKLAVDQGTLNPNQIPPELRKLVESVKLPTVTPNQQTVNLTP
mgnify:CR=1 FL=1